MKGSTKKLKDKISVASKVIPMYHVAWKAKLTGASGYGTGIYPYEQATQIVETLNSVEALCIHRIDQIKDVEEKTNVRLSKDN